MLTPSPPSNPLPRFEINSKKKGLVGSKLLPLSCAEPVVSTSRRAPSNSAQKQTHTSDVVMLVISLPRTPYITATPAQNITTTKSEFIAIAAFSVLDVSLVKSSSSSVEPPTKVLVSYQLPMLSPTTAPMSDDLPLTPSKVYVLAQLPLAPSYINLPGEMTSTSSMNVPFLAPFPNKMPTAGAPLQTPVSTRQLLHVPRMTPVPGVPPPQTSPKLNPAALVFQPTKLLISVPFLAAQGKACSTLYSMSRLY